jgi:tRNA threonylcarbamoyl adenosine modification protein YjeE
VNDAADKRSASVAGTERLGAAIAPTLRIGDVIAVSGPLGAGKTRFVAGIVHARAPGAHVRSPSFTLVNEHAGAPPVFHLDLYRLNGVRDIEGLGLEEYAEQGVLVVEWGERLPYEWLATALHVAITPGEGDERRFTASGRGERGRELLQAWCALPEAW